MRIVAKDSIRRDSSLTWFCGGNEFAGEWIWDLMGIRKSTTRKLFATALQCNLHPENRLQQLCTAIVASKTSYHQCCTAVQWIEQFASYLRASKCIAQATRHLKIKNCFEQFQIENCSKIHFDIMLNESSVNISRLCFSTKKRSMPIQRVPYLAFT